GDVHRHRRVAVDAPLDVELRMRVAREDDEHAWAALGREAVQQLVDGDQLVALQLRAAARAEDDGDLRNRVRIGRLDDVTKSKCPSEIHWWSTLAPSSSTSRFTSRSRSGCDWSVRRPWSVSVVSMR